jgi:hypothetical protein
MGCCGDRRAAQRQGSAGASKAGSPAPRAPQAVSPILFELTGPRAIQVIGLYTGAVYTFAQTGARLLVHGADAAAVAKLPLLRPVRSTGAISGHTTV